MEVFLRELMPRVIGDKVTFSIYPSQGKQAHRNQELCKHWSVHGPPEVKPARATIQVFRRYPRHDAGDRLADDSRP